MAFYLAGEITQVIDSIPWVRCASGNVFFNPSLNQYRPSYNKFGFHCFYFALKIKHDGGAGGAIGNLGLARIVDHLIMAS